MLHPYQYLDNKDIYRIQEFVKHTVLEVWCKPSRKFSKNLLHVDFRTMTKSINKVYIIDPIKKVYSLCKTLSPAQLQLLSDAYTENNDIVGLCEGRGTPVLYAQLKQQLGKEITNQIYIFCTSLYKHVLGLEPFYSLFGKQEDHYRDFSAHNSLVVCPFCGINGMLNHNSYPKREAYDHFLPKETYPFTAVNFYNLAPACHHCNSSYKSRKDPLNLREGGPRQSAFYPFRVKDYDIGIEIKVADQDQIKNITPVDIAVTLDCNTHIQEKETWNNIFSITDRYKKECCDFGFGWVTDAHTAVTLNNEVVSYDAYINISRRSIEPRSRIKTAFLESLTL